MSIELTNFLRATADLIGRQYLVGDPEDIVSKCIEPATIDPPPQDVPDEEPSPSDDIPPPVSPDTERTIPEELICRFLDTDIGMNENEWTFYKDGYKFKLLDATSSFDSPEPPRRQFPPGAQSALQDIANLILVTPLPLPDSEGDWIGFQFDFNESVYKVVYIHTGRSVGDVSA